MNEAEAMDGRTRHYGAFYGVEDARRDDRPLLVVWGNCQAEALRIVLESAPELPFRTVRVPPVHELTPADIPHVQRLASEVRAVISQPVRTGYRGLPIGTADLAASAPNARTIVWPVIRYCGLFPFQAIVRHPGDPSAVPAGVPYHDLRTVVAVHRDSDDWDVEIDSEQIKEAARWSVEELARRERAHTDVAVSDVLLAAGAGAANTINHPGNAVLLELGRRVLDMLGAPGSPSVDRELLGNISAPLEGRVAEALGLSAQPRPDWVVDGHRITEDTIRSRQTDWYRAHPEFIGAALERYASLLDILGMAR